jgi:lipopolysaccharide export system protein LptC
MMDRRYWTRATLLALLAIASQGVYWWLKPRPPADAFVGPPRSDYSLTDFTLNALDSKGGLAYTVTGPSLARRGEDGSVFVTRPDYVMIDGNGKPWNGTSESAWISKDGAIMKLEGKVEMHRVPAEGVRPATIETADLVTRPKDKRMQTDAATRITQPGSILQGVGMRADLDGKNLELLSDVHATLETPGSTRD